MIRDAYLQSESIKSVYPEFETFHATTASYLANGDSLILRIDYQDSLWDTDYQHTREVVQIALSQFVDEMEQQLIQ